MVKKYSRSLDQIIIAMASLQEGNEEEATEALQQALEEEDLDETLAELEAQQEEAEEAEDMEEATADEDFVETIEEAFEDETGVEVAHVRGRMIVTLSNVNNARKAKRVFASLDAVDDVKDVDVDELGLDAEDAIEANIDGEDVIVAFDADGSAEIFQKETEEVNDDFDEDEDDEDDVFASKRPGKKAKVKASVHKVTSFKSKPSKTVANRKRSTIVARVIRNLV